MNLLRLLPLVAALGATPALATGGFTCSIKDDPTVRLSIVTGMAPGMVVAQARLQQEDRLRTTSDEGDEALRIAQSWIGDRDLRLDLVDRAHMHYVARLDAVRNKSDDFIGTLTVDGRARPTVCTSDH